MTLKHTAAGLAHAGKPVLFTDPKLPRAHKERLIRSFAYALRHETNDVFGPGMGTDETCMAGVKDETGRGAGLLRSGARHQRRQRAQHPDRGGVSRAWCTKTTCSG